MYKGHGTKLAGNTEAANFVGRYSAQTAKKLAASVFALKLA